MTGWDGTFGVDTDNKQPSEYDMIISRIQDAEYTRDISDRNANPDKGLGDNVNVDLVRKIISEISDKIRNARENGEYEIKYPLSFLGFPLTWPKPSKKELEIICNMLKKKKYVAYIRTEEYTFISISWMLIDPLIFI